jgi:cell division protein FtsI/penicillin-binding protein 2
MRFSRITFSFTLLSIASILGAGLLAAASQATTAKKITTAAVKKKTTTAAVKKKITTAAVKKKTTTTAVKKTTPAKRVVRTRPSQWSEPTFADSTIGDDLEGENLAVRRAAVEALGRYNGSVVVVDPNTGRVLSMVNQRVALGGAFQPCSTIKLPVAMAALAEGIINRDTVLRVANKRLTLTEALARSDNPFFASLGVKLGFERFRFYARLLGLGEKAGLGIEGEQPGVFPDSPAGFGVGLMSSYGEGIALTPLQLASLVSSFANGGTLYYLQYPRTNEELLSFVPRVKRHLDIEPWLSEIKPGMMAAVEYGTARRANFDPAEPVLGKTGTCTDNRTHLGWFGSFNDAGPNKLVVVVLLTGGRGVSGAAAAEIAGDTYRRLSREDFFAAAREYTPSALISTQSCCGQ